MDLKTGISSQDLDTDPIIHNCEKVRVGVHLTMTELQFTPKFYNLNSGQGPPAQVSNPVKEETPYLSSIKIGHSQDPGLRPEVIGQKLYYHTGAIGEFIWLPTGPERISPLSSSKKKKKNFFSCQLNFQGPGNQ